MCGYEPTNTHTHTHTCIYIYTYTHIHVHTYALSMSSIEAHLTLPKGQGIRLPKRIVEQDNHEYNVTHEKNHAHVPPYIFLHASDAPDRTLDPLNRRSDLLNRRTSS
jgi:hypothetical protein